MQNPDILSILEKQRKFFETGATKDPEFRIKTLRKLKTAVREREERIFRALKDDLGKSAFESYASEVGVVLEEIGVHLKGLKKWSKPRSVPTPLYHFPASGKIMPEPRGITLVFSPWNYPFQLTLVPVIGAVSAGDCCVIKPSRYSPRTSEEIGSLIRDHFGEEHLCVFHGGADINQRLLKEKYDLIFFTGSPSVGKVVMEAAAKHVTPVVLELGGKSPVIVEDDADLKLAARRIIWGKCLNAGQTCVAPDYLLVNRKVRKELLERMTAQISEFFGDDPERSEDFSRIVNDKHFERLRGLLKNTQIVAGGKTNAETRYVSPTIVEGVNEDSPIMREEVFGPILPVLEYDTLDEAIRFVNRRPKPLALYFFSGNARKQERVLRETSSGGCCINEVVAHFVNPYLPFGGVGESGMGSYHGRASFEAFSHLKPVMKKSVRIDISLRYPPTKGKLWLAKKFLK